MRPLLLFAMWLFIFGLAPAELLRDYRAPYAFVFLSALLAAASEGIAQKFSDKR